MDLTDAQCDILGSEVFEAGQHAMRLVAPLWIASGAGAIARQIIGTTVIGGMVAETSSGDSLFPQSST